MTIQSLFLAGSPPAVAGFIIAVIINPLNCHPGRSRPHIFNEGIERRNPPLAYSYAASTIAAVILHFRIQTPLLHLLPYMPDRIGAKAMGVAEIRRCCPPYTATTDRVPGMEAIESYKTGIPAVAQAFPDDAPALTVFRRAQGSQSSETLPGDIARRSADSPVGAY